MIRGGRSKYSIRDLAGAYDNIRPNLRQLSASVAWHPVLGGGGGGGFCCSISVTFFLHLIPRIEDSCKRVGGCHLSIPLGESVCQ